MKRQLPLFLICLFCVGCSSQQPSKISTPDNAAQARKLHRSGENAVKRGQYNEAVDIFQQEAKIFKLMGAFQTSSREVAYDYAENLMALGAAQARAGNVDDALESWNSASSVYYCNGLRRSAVTSGPQIYFERSKRGLMLVEANFLLFKVPHFKENPFEKQVMVYSDSAQKQIPFLQSFANAELLQIRKYHVENVYPWNQSIRIDEAKFLKDFMPQRPGHVQAGTYGEIVCSGARPELLPTDLKLKGAQVLFAGDDLNRTAPIPYQRLTAKTLKEFEDALDYDNRLHHDAQKEFQRYLLTRWNASRMNEFCTAETRCLGLRKYPLYTNDLPLSNGTLTLPSTSRPCELVWSAQFVRFPPMDAEARVRAGQYFAKKVLNKQEWLLDYGSATTRQWNEDDYLKHRIETELLNGLDNQRLQSSKLNDFVVTSEDDLKQPLVERSIAIVSNRAAKIVRSPNGTAVNYECLLPAGKKLEVKLDAKQQVTAILVDGKSDNIWWGALEKLRRGGGPGRNINCTIVYAKNISKGSILKDDDFEIVNINESDLPLDAVNYGTIAEGRVATTNLKKASLVRLRDIGLSIIPNYLPRISYKTLLFVKSSTLLHAARPLPKETIISLNDLDIINVSINKVPPHSLISPYDAIGRKTSYPLDKGEILYRTHVGLDW